jgi:hypothetical protein
MRDHEKKELSLEDDHRTDSLDSHGLRNTIGLGVDGAFLIKVGVINKEIARMGMGRFRESSGGANPMENSS